MASCGEVLVAIMNNHSDWAIAQEQRWYRIPIEQVEKLQHRKQWLPPKWLAFYQTKVFDHEAYTISYYAEVEVVQEVSRQDLFPNEEISAKSQNRYCKLELKPIQKLTASIRSDRPCRLTFIATTWEKLTTAQAIRDL
jgi:hypothetical protein